MHFKQSKLLITAAIANAAFFSVHRAHADDVSTTWLGGMGSWNTPSNWSGGVVPNNNGTITFDVFVPSGTVTLSANGQFITTVDALNIGPGATALALSSELQIQKLLSIDGNFRTLGIQPVLLSASAILQGAGTLNCSGNFQQTSGVVVPNGLTVVEFAQGSVLGDLTTPFVNNGSIVGGNSGQSYSPILSGSTFKNNGTIEARNGAFRLGGGPYTLEDLGTLVWGSNGRFAISGTLNNLGKTFVVDANDPWELNDGTISGGTVQIAAGSTLSTPYTAGANLQNVVINGRLNFNGEFRPLNIVDGTLKGNAEIVLGGTTLDGSSRVVTTSPSLTIASTVYIHGGGGGNPQSIYKLGSGSGVGNGTGPVVNHGTIRADVAVDPFNTFSTSELDLSGTSITNDGTLAINSSAFIYVSRGNGFNQTADPSDLIFQPGGTLAVQLSAVSGTGLLDVTGSLDLTATNDALLLSNSADVINDTFYRIAVANGGIIGQFDSISDGYVVELRNNNTELWAESVPEPITGAMLSTSGFIFLAKRRRAN